MKTRSFIIGLSTIALVFNMASAANAAAVRINVTGELEKDRDSSKTESDKSSSKTKTESQTYELEVTVANTGKQDGVFDLEWYFFKRSYVEKGKLGDPEVCEKGKTKLTINGMKRVKHPLKSKKLTWTESKTNKSSKKNSNSSSKNTNTKKISGDEYDGYVLFVKQDGKIVASHASDKKYLKPEWMRALD